MFIDLRKPVRRVCPHCLGRQLAVERSGWNALRSAFNLLACGVSCVGYLIGTFFWLLFVVTHPLTYSIFYPNRPHIESFPRIGLWRRCRRCGASMLDGAEPGFASACGRCGYDLTGNRSGTCPECGWAVPAMTRTLLHYEAGQFVRGPAPESPPGRAPSDQTLI